MSDPMETEDKKTDDAGGNNVALCASCDRCRSRKTKCDGKRPCSNCTAKYMKKHKVESIEGVDLAAFECIYSPAKRRGPVPGKSTGNARKASEMDSPGAGGASNADWDTTGANGASAAALAMLQGSGAAVAGASSVSAAIQQQLEILRQLQANNDKEGAQAMEIAPDEPSARRARVAMVEGDAATPNLATTLLSHMHLIRPNSSEGARLFAYYKLSVDELYRLPQTPSDQEYGVLYQELTQSQRAVPPPHLSALAGARFVELALGALVHNEGKVADELYDAATHCLMEAGKGLDIDKAKELAASSKGGTPSADALFLINPLILLQTAKAFFLRGVFQANVGNMKKYFKYRRVCMNYLSLLGADIKDASILTAAVSFMDAWAYMVYNADESALPVDDSIPRAGCGGLMAATDGNQSADKNFLRDTKTDTFSICVNKDNKNWMQGAPPVYLNNEAPMHARSLDAIACAVRTCCDQANSRFAMIAKMAKEQAEQDGASGDAAQAAANFAENEEKTATTVAVLAHENELCSRNMILSAYTLMQQHDSSSDGKPKHQGQNVVITAMDGFLENSDEEGQSGFTDSQIQSFLSVCNTVIENPLLLHHAGPTYHMVTNAAVMLCHLLNGMHAMSESDEFGTMERALFDEILDALVPVRRLLIIHRRKLPVKLRCHALPRPKIGIKPSEGPIVDLGETLLCVCRGCQGFVLQACSPCVAAERAQNAESRLQMEVAQEAEAVELGEMGEREMSDLNAQFDFDDDELLNIVGDLDW